MNTDEFKTKLDANRLGKYFDKLKPLLRNTIRLRLRPANENDMRIGQTKIGGQPDLPPEITWATETTIIDENQETITKSLSFIAQINLAETVSFDKEKLLPESGLLYFFYSAEQDAWGFDYKDKNKFKVIYWNGDSSVLKRTNYPNDLPEYACFKPCAVNITSEVSFPSYGHEVYENFENGEDDTFWEEIYNEGNLNKLLGYSDNIQSEMELECELVTNGLYCGDPSGFNDPRAKALEPNAKNWLLLLQIDSNDENEMMWGDCGRLYFWIKKDDLKNKQLDKCWFCLQCS